MKEQAKLSLANESTGAASENSQDAVQKPIVEPVVLTPPPIPWEELERRHAASQKGS